MPDRPSHKGYYMAGLLVGGALVLGLNIKEKQGGSSEKVYQQARRDLRGVIPDILEGCKYTGNARINEIYNALIDRPHLQAIFMSNHPDFDLNKATPLDIRFDEIGYCSVTYDDGKIECVDSNGNGAWESIKGGGHNGMTPDSLQEKCFEAVEGVLDDYQGGIGNI